MTRLVAMCQASVDAYLASAGADVDGIDLHQHVIEIVARNVASGRVGRVMRAQGDATASAPKAPATDTTAEDAPPRPAALSEAATQTDDDQRLTSYIERVIKFYLQEHHRIEQLAAQDERAWNALYDELVRRAGNLVRSLDPSSVHGQGEIDDFAQQACQAIFTHPFPFDVSFDPWAALILRNVVLQRYRKSSDAMDHFSSELDPERPVGAESNLADFKRVETREQLLQAIARLRSTAQQQVIIDLFLYGLSEAEVAQKLGKTENAVRILQHRALRHLKKILTE